ncbi:MAG: hypothetical protein JW798_03345 [Prolixibacteraceae bacterium]|nr:hypothetical protein [Prolixibacteraceae bacterium]
MSSEDYLIRQFRMLATVLARIMGFHENKEHLKALELIEQTLVTWFGIDLDSPEEKLSAYVNHPSHNFEEEKAIAELYYQRAKTLFLLNKNEPAVLSAHTALGLFITIDEQSGHFSIEIQQRIADLKKITSSE